MTVGELREKLSTFEANAKVFMLFDTPFRIESHNIESVTDTPESNLFHNKENTKGNVYLQWRVSGK